MSDVKINSMGEALKCMMMEVRFDGCYYKVIYGTDALGSNFFCIPNWNVGGDLAGFDDIFWNKESLSVINNDEAANVIARVISITEKAATEECDSDD